MSNKTRKHLWPVSLVMSIGIIGALAAFLVLSANPGATNAHGPDDHPDQGWPACADMTDAQRGIHNGIHGNVGVHGTMDPCPDPSIDDEKEMDDSIARVTADGKMGGRTASGASEIQLTIDELPMDMSVGSSIVLYLEDDFAEPDSIPASSVYLVATGDADNVVPAAGQTMADAEAAVRRQTGNGARVYVTNAPKLKNSDYFTKDKKDIAIRVLVPDMCTNATDECEGPNGLRSGQTVSLVVESDSGIKNPSEAGDHSTGYALLGPTGEIPNPPTYVLNVIMTVAKITLSDVDNSRGYEMTVTGTGFNDGTSADVYVLAGNAAVWDTLDCDAMNAAAGSSDTMGNGYCQMYADLSATEKATVHGLDFTTGDAEAAACAGIVRAGTKVGSALVGSNDNAEVTFEVTAPTFKPGNVNYLCMVDGEGRLSDTDVEDFNLEPSIKVVPNNVATGDTVNVFAQDYGNTGAGFSLLKIGGQTNAPNGAALSGFITDRESISTTGEGSITFKIPGGLEGVLRVDAMWGEPNDDGKCVASDGCISKNSKITIAGAELNASQTDVLPNETVTITGNGFGTQTCIPFSNITLDNVAVMVHDDSAATRCGTSAGKGVEVSNSGQFVATIILWPAGAGGTNPSLIPGTHELNVEDSDDYAASIKLTIADPSITVTPAVAGPRDYITITGENWPVDNLDNSLSEPITVVIEDYQNGRTYPVYADSVGRITVEHRIHRRVAIPDTVQVKANYDDGKVVKIGSFAVPASTITVTPDSGQPGDLVTLTAGNMPVYTEADYIEIGGTTYTDPGVNTDRDGNITVEDVLVPGLDPGVYSVVINVDGTIAIGEVNVLAESSARGAGAELPGALEGLDDNLLRVFHFNDVNKSWDFYDPRDEFAEFNTLTALVNGEPYWVLVSEGQEDVVLNNRARTFTCVGGDCWNQIVW